LRGFGPPALPKPAPRACLVDHVINDQEGQSACAQQPDRNAYSRRSTRRSTRGSDPPPCSTYRCTWQSRPNYDSHSPSSGQSGLRLVVVPGPSGMECCRACATPRPWPKVGQIWPISGQIWARSADSRMIPAIFGPFSARLWAIPGHWKSLRGPPTRGGPKMGLIWPIPGPNRSHPSCGAASPTPEDPAGSLSWPVLGHFRSLSGQKRARSGSHSCSLRAAFFQSSAPGGAMQRGMAPC
jgi:hypothetical protein